MIDADLSVHIPMQRTCGLGRSVLLLSLHVLAASACPVRIQT